MQVNINPLSNSVVADSVEGGKERFPEDDDPLALECILGKYLSFAQWFVQAIVRSFDRWFLFILSFV